MLVESAPVRRLWPLNVVRSAIACISLCSWPTSVAANPRSVSPIVPFAACVASSFIRCSMFCSSPTAPSAVCSIEIPSFALRTAWFKLRIWADMRWVTARPAASSFALLMRRPDDRRCSATFIADCEPVRLRCAFSEATLVLMIWGMVVSFDLGFQELPAPGGRGRPRLVRPSAFSDSNLRWQAYRAAVSETLGLEHASKGSDAAAGESFEQREFHPSHPRCRDSPYVTDGRRSNVQACRGRATCDPHDLITSLTGGIQHERRSNARRDPRSESHLPHAVAGTDPQGPRAGSLSAWPVGTCGRSDRRPLGRADPEDRRDEHPDVPL